MSENTTRYWIMDWHGWMLDHDPISDSLVRRPFQPGRYPGVSFHIPADQPLPARAIVRKTVSMPRMLPALDMIPLPDSNLVALSQADASGYLTCAHLPHPYGEIRFNSASIQDWEQFLPLTDAMLRGLAILISPTVTTLTTESGLRLEDFIFRDPMTLWAGAYALPLEPSRDILEQISTLAPGQTLTIPLRLAEEDRICACTLRVNGS